VAGIFHHQKTAHSQNVAVFFYPVHLIRADGFFHYLLQQLTVAPANIKTM
jgi:hypothetical protein